MPLLDASVAQPSLQDYASVMKVQGLMHGSASSNLSFTSRKRLGCRWRIFGTPNKHCHLELVDMRRGELIIKAVATLENRSSVQSGKGKEIFVFEVKQVHLLGEDSEEVDEPEKLRRLRISKANKGNTPWNKGRKHSAETLRRIKEKTRLAMQDPKVKMKLANKGHSQTDDTKMKIAVGVKIGWERRRQRMLQQQICHSEWQNLIAEASRSGFSSEEKFQWDSYKVLEKQQGHVWIKSVEQRKKPPRVIWDRNAPKSIDQRRKISEAISAKWSDPDYRNRVCSAQAKYYGTPEGIERKPKRNPIDSLPHTISKTANEKTSKVVSSLSEIGPKILSAQVKLKRSNLRKYKDPMANSKLEMIKNIRAQRGASDTKKMETIARARLMIGEAERAAKALEASASTNPHLMASLIETRKLINEAIQSIQSIDATTLIDYPVSVRQSSKNSECSSAVAREGGMVKGINENNVKINGTHAHALTNQEDSDFSDLVPHVSLENKDKDKEEVLSVISNGYASGQLLNSSAASVGLNKQVQQPDSPDVAQTLSSAREQKLPSNPILNTTWVRGRLVIVHEKEKEEDNYYYELHRDVASGSLPQIT